MDFINKGWRRITLCRLSEEGGYTLVELMIYISLFLIIVLFFQPLLHLFGQPSSLLGEIRLEREARLFFQHLEQEVNEASSYRIDGTQLELKVDTNSITYDQLHQVIRRKLNTQGYVVMVQFVKKVEFVPVNNQAFLVRLQLQQGESEFNIERWLGLKINETNETNEINETKL